MVHAALINVFTCTVLSIGPLGGYGSLRLKQGRIHLIKPQKPWRGQSLKRHNTAHLRASANQGIDLVLLGGRACVINEVQVSKPIQRCWIRVSGVHTSEISGKPYKLLAIALE